MALTAKQRAKLPASAFVYHAGPRSKWRYPVPTKAQAQKAGISEKQRQRMLSTAKAYSVRPSTKGTRGRVGAVANKRK